MDKIRVMLPKNLHLSEFRTPYSGMFRVPITEGETFDYAVIDNPEVITRIVNDQSMVYEVIA